MMGKGAAQALSHSTHTLFHCRGWAQFPGLDLGFGKMQRRC